MAGCLRNATTGLQLPRRLADAHLHDAARGGRQADPVWVHRRLHAEPGARAADALLLERAVVGQGEGEAEGGADRGAAALVDHDGGRAAEEQRPDHPPPRLERACSGFFFWMWFRSRAPAAGYFFYISAFANHNRLFVFLCVITVCIFSSWRDKSAVPRVFPLGGLFFAVRGFSTAFDEGVMCSTDAKNS